MDEHAAKRASGKLGFSRRGPSLTLRSPIHEDRSSQYCSRLGCGSKLDSTKDAHVGDQEKSKYSKASFRTASSKAIAESSSRIFSSNPLQYRKKQTCVQEILVGESSSRGARSEDSYSESASNPDSKDLESASPHGFSNNSNDTLGGCNIASTSRTHKQINRRLGLGKKESLDSPGQHSFVPRSMTRTTKPQSFGWSSSDLGQNRRVDVVRPSNVDNLSIGATSTIGSSSGGYPSSSYIHPSPQQASRRDRNQSTNRDAAVSVRTRRAHSGGARSRLHEQEEDNVGLSWTRFLMIDDIPESSSQSFPVESNSVSRNTFRRSGTNGQTPHSRLSRNEGRSTQIFGGPSRNTDGYQNFNVEGIAEVLLALERIEQDEELTYEQLMVLETNLLLGGLSFHDQHRDLRLDIDNMTYEELLALEEKMGNVSTALSEEALSKCVKRSIFMLASVLPRRGLEDVKCSICQEEYAIDEEVGELACKHRYHVACIHQWLRQKKWCPVCKTAVYPS